MGRAAVSEHGRLGGRTAGRAALAASLAAAVLAGAAGAGTGSPAIGYTDFSSVAGLTLNGDAAQAGSALRLAPAASLRRGSAWSAAPLETGRSFSTRFRVAAHDGSVYPGDGLTFTLQSQGPSALGDNGGAHGYAGLARIAPSVAVDVSLFPQIFNGGTEAVGILVNGDNANPVATGTSAARLYGAPFTVWVDYDAATHALRAFVDAAGTKPARPLASATVDLAATVGPSAYVGFTAGTGVFDADFDLLDWELTVPGGPLPPPPPPADTTPPAVACAAKPDVLWPPNGRLVQVATTVSVTDGDSGPAGFRLVSVTSSEGDAAAQSRDWTPGTADTAGLLQAARRGTGKGRAYALTYRGSDAAGNAATCTATVTVPHDQGR